MSKEKKVIERKNINVFWALVPLFIMIVCMLFWVVKLKQAPHIPLMIGTASCSNCSTQTWIYVGAD